jgi:hypothetical protein
MTKLSSALFAVVVLATLGASSSAADGADAAVDAPGETRSVAGTPVTIPASERAALVAFYTATNGDGWTNKTNWKLPPLSGDGFAEPGTECTWFGVTCSADGSTVEYFGLIANNLDGRLAPELAALTNLRSLDIEENSGLVGSIPAELGTLAALEHLNLIGNQLTGSIPPEIFDIPTLSQLLLDLNPLTGSIPSGLGARDMFVVYLGNSGFTGSIPSDFGNLTNVIWLHLQGNRLTGAIPPGLSNLTNANDFQIGYNALWTDDTALRTFLDTADPGWEATQTIAPSLTVASVTDRTVWLEWTPIPYTGDSGSYEIYRNVMGSPDPVFAGASWSKLEGAFPVTGLEPGQSYDLTALTITRPHAQNANTVISEMSGPVAATTSNFGCATPTIAITGHSAPFSLSVTSSHDSFEWSTGETAASIAVDPPGDGWYWVRALGPGSCDEAAVVSPTLLFSDGFETGNLSPWSSIVGGAP